MLFQALKFATGRDGARVVIHPYRGCSGRGHVLGIEIRVHDEESSRGDP